MKILVVIASFGCKNDEYLRQVIGEYRSMSHEVDIVVASNLSKRLDHGVELLLVNLQGSDPHTLPFAHKQVFADRLAAYDLFIYSEDDTLITERNIAAFVRASQVLPPDELPGFLNTEITPDGPQYFCNINLHFHWDSTFLRTRGEYTVAYFTNEHSASYALTQAQLRRVLASGGFLVGAHQGRYNWACSAATDPYTQCGSRKVICISHLDDFLVRHLPTIKYRGRSYAERSEVDLQLRALESLRRGEHPCEPLLETDTKLPERRYSKSYYEPCREEVISLIPYGARSVLSVGCGWGATEGSLVKRGVRVVVIPLDAVIAACAKAKGVEIVYGSLENARRELGDEKFDCVYIPNILHLAPDPAGVLASFGSAVVSRGAVIVTVPNMNDLSTLWRRWRRDRQYSTLGSFAKSGVHVMSHRALRDWFRRAQTRLDRIVDIVPSRRRRLGRLCLGCADEWLAEELIGVGRRL